MIFILEKPANGDQNKAHLKIEQRGAAAHGKGFFLSGFSLALLLCAVYSLFKGLVVWSILHAIYIATRSKLKC